MVNYRRNFIPGATYFFTVALEDRRRDTLTKNILALRQAFRTTRSERPFQIDAIVVLPEHLHAIWTLPSSDSDFSGRWRRVKSLFTHHLRRAGESFDPRDGRGFRLWQRRFWEHTIRDLRDYARHVDYVHYNPVHHGYVKIAALWPYSSIHRFIRRGTITADWGATPDQEDGDYGEP